MRQNPTDFHPHDPFVSGAVRELARINAELQRFEADLEGQNPSIISCLQHLVPWYGLPEPTVPPLRALRQLLHNPDFIDLLPFVLEKFNTADGYTDLPNRGRDRNLDRCILDTYYTPLDLARWLALQTTKRAVDAVMHRFLIDKENVDTVLRQLQDITVCDLSCGAGILLREALAPIASAYRQVYESIGEHEATRFSKEAPLFARGFVKLQSLFSNVYGVDISPQAVESARTVLAVWAADDLHEAGLTAADSIRWLKLNIQVGSGSHWSKGVEEAFDIKTSEALARKALHRHHLRQLALQAAELSDGCSEIEILDRFPEVFTGANPGFHCVIGNPPFGILPEHVQTSPQTGPPSCFSFGLPQEPMSKWQYPKFVEGALRLTRSSGYGAIVTPLNLAYSRELSGLRGLIQSLPRRSTFVFFDRSPDALFGDKVKTRNVVLLVEPSDHVKSEIWTTHLLRWTRAGRPKLWNEIVPTRLWTEAIQDFVPKLGTQLEVDSWTKIRAVPNRLRSLLSAAPPHGRVSMDAGAIYMYSTAYNWLPAFRTIPANPGSVASPSMRTYRFSSARDADIVYACLVSSIAFWLWTVESDGFHVTDGFVLDLPFVPHMFSAPDAELLSELGREHDFTVRSNPTVKSNAGLKIANVNRQSAVHISHRIDEVLARSLGLPPAFLGLVRERVAHLVYVGRQQTRATIARHLHKENYAETR